MTNRMLTTWNSLYVSTTRNILVGSRVLDPPIIRMPYISGGCHLHSSRDMDVLLPHATRYTRYNEFYSVFVLPR